MYFKQFFVEGLGHSSYMIASDQTKEAAVVDPRRDIEVYLEEAGRQGFTIRYALETHNHNDFLSGARALTLRSDAEQVASAESHLRFPYRAVTEGDEIRIGEILVKVLFTPGHTPEHISYVVIDTARADVPVLAFTGGDLLVGAVGRPDLLGRELGEKLAPMLYDSLHGKILKLEDYVEVLPTHGSGSLCGRGISGRLTSTIGYERRFNQALQIKDRNEFVRFVLSDNPGIPTYYRRMRPANQLGPADWKEPEARALSPDEVRHLAGHGALVLDTRPHLDCGSGHIPGAVNIGLEASLVTWVGWLLPEDVPMVLVLEDENQWSQVVAALARIGYEKVVGFLQGGMESWRSAHLPIVQVDQWSTGQLKAEIESGRVDLLDVRTDSEWESGHIAGAVHLSLDKLAEVSPGLDPEEPLAVICGSGHRSSIAVSLLLQRGYKKIANVHGGMEDWERAGYPTTSLEETQAAGMEQSVAA